MNDTQETPRCAFKPFEGNEVCGQDATKVIVVPVDGNPTAVYFDDYHFNVVTAEGGLTHLNYIVGNPYPKPEEVPHQAHVDVPWAIDREKEEDLRPMVPVTEVSPQQDTPKALVSQEFETGEVLWIPKGKTAQEAWNQIHGIADKPIGTLQVEGEA